MSIESLVEILLEEDDPPAVWTLIEASVHLGTRGKTFTASFRGPSGKQTWRSTGLTDRDQALALARKWEEEEKRKRAAQGEVSTKPTMPAKPGGLTQAEIAALWGLSERGVREIERRALSKLRRHPALRQFWQEWTGEVEESGITAAMEWNLSQAEIDAVLALAETPLERQALRKLIALTRT